MVKIRSRWSRRTVTITWDENFLIIYDEGKERSTFCVPVHLNYMEVSCLSCLSHQHTRDLQFCITFWLPVEVKTCLMSFSGISPPIHMEINTYDQLSFLYWRHTSPLSIIYYCTKESRPCRLDNNSSDQRRSFLDEPQWIYKNHEESIVCFLVVVWRWQIC